MADKRLSEVLLGWVNRYFHAWGCRFHVTFMKYLHMPSIVGARATKLPGAVPAMTWGVGEEIEAGDKTMGQCKE